MFTSLMFFFKCGCAFRSTPLSSEICYDLAGSIQFSRENQELNVEDVQPVKFDPLMIQGLECRLAIFFRNRMSWMHCGRLMEPE